jgi:hypothetical protein
MSLTHTHTHSDPIKGADTRRVWEAIELSHDHGTENLEERKRLIEAHPNEDDIVLDERVKGSLQPTRGIGDGLFKDPNFNDGTTRTLKTSIFSCNIVGSETELPRALRSCRLTTQLWPASLRTGIRPTPLPCPKSSPTRSHRVRKCILRVPCAPTV